MKFPKRHKRLTQGNRLAQEQPHVQVLDFVIGCRSNLWYVEELPRDNRQGSEHIRFHNEAGYMIAPPSLIRKISYLQNGGSQYMRIQEMPDDHYRGLA